MLLSISQKHFIYNTARVSIKTFEWINQSCNIILLVLLSPKEIISTYKQSQHFSFLYRVFVMSTNV